MALSNEDLLAISRLLDTKFDASLKPIENRMERIENQVTSIDNRVTSYHNNEIVYYYFIV